MTDVITYQTLLDRCEADALDFVPTPPEGSTDLDDWREYLDTLDTISDDVPERADEVENWDWCIYTRYGMLIIPRLSSAELNEAEEDWIDSRTGSDLFDFGVYEMASQVLFFALRRMMTAALEELIEQRRELAEDAIEALETEQGEVS